MTSRKLQFLKAAEYFIKKAAEEEYQPEPYPEPGLWDRMWDAAKTVGASIFDPSKPVPLYPGEVEPENWGLDSGEYRPTKWPRRMAPYYPGMSKIVDERNRLNWKTSQLWKQKIKEGYKPGPQKQEQPTQQHIINQNWGNPTPKVRMNPYTGKLEKTKY